MLLLHEGVSQLAPAALVVGLALILATGSAALRPRIRVLFLGASIVLNWRYLLWRFESTLPSSDDPFTVVAAWAFFGLEAVTVIAATIAGLFLSRSKDRSGEADAHAAWWVDGPAPRVDVYIATFNEGLDVLGRTIAGALALDYPRVRVFVLDDGRRPWLADLCAQKAVGYLTRSDNDHAKAGNLNNAFWTRQRDDAPPDFIAILDADFVPHRNFIERAIGLFHDGSVGLVQTPQYFFNADPIQHNLGLTKVFPDEQRFFFDHVQPSRDAWGIAICCGTSSMIRADALRKIGGVPTGSVTEDFLLTLRLSEFGWKTVYLNEPLTEGLAPEGLKEYATQRERWCLGLMQIVRNCYNPLGINRLSVMQRLSTLDSLLYWTSTSLFRMASILCPLLYWYFGIMVVDASTEGILQYFVPAYLASLIALNWISGGLILPVVIDVSQLIAAFPITRAVISGLCSGKAAKFRVTDKGGSRTRSRMQWPLVTALYALNMLTLAGLSLALFSDYHYGNTAGDGRVIILMWSLYNHMVLSFAVFSCVERVRPRHPMRDRWQEAYFETSAGTTPCSVSELSVESACIAGLSQDFSDRVGVLKLDGIGGIPAEIDPQWSGRGIRVTLHPSGAQRDAIWTRLHTGRGAPGVTGARITGVAAALMLRLLKG